MQAQSQSPRETLKQYLADLQRDTDNHSLREKIIKVVQELKPPPEIPEDARRHFVKAATVQKESKDAQALDLAIGEYKQALLTAPRWAEAYYNLGVASEQAGRFDTAIDALKLYLLTNPSATEAREAQDRLYAIEGKKDLAARNAAAEAEAARRKKQEEDAQRDEQFRRLAGTWVRILNTTPENHRYDDIYYFELTVTGDREFTLKWTRFHSNINGDNVVRPYEEVYRISAHGQQLTGTASLVENFSYGGCGVRQHTDNVTGSISEGGDKIELVRSGPEFYIRSCEFKGHREEHVRLERER
jgi:tetratricopeptide (TPR) repeat protein